MSTNTPMMHSIAPSNPNVKSMGSLDFLSGRIKKTRSSSTTVKNIHGILNIVSWGILMTTRAINARHLKKFESVDPLWFYLHVSYQLLAYILGGFMTGLFLAKGLMELNIHRTRSLASPCSVLQQQRCLVAWSDLAKIASIVPSSTSSISWWVIR
ncbi:hypothetical protein Peur_002721 [Populus x canadensis]